MVAAISILIELDGAIIFAAVAIACRWLDWQLRLTRSLPAGRRAVHHVLGTWSRRVLLRCSLGEIEYILVSV